MRSVTEFREAAAALLTDEDYIVFNDEVTEAGDGAGVYVTARIFVRYTDNELHEVKHAP